MDYYKLQNGSDIRGVAMEGIAGQPITLTTQACADFAMGFAVFLKQKHGNQKLKIAIGHDSRITAQALKEAMIERLVSMGVNVIDCGLASTPAMFMSTMFTEFQCDGAMMITASHLPFNRNGIKFFDKTGGMNKTEIKQIIDLAHQPFTETVGGSLDSMDLIGRYSLHLQEIIKKQVNHPTSYDFPLAGMHIVVDAGNGAGGFYATHVLAPLGANITGSQFLEPDGMFPNHIPNPENAEAMAAICNAVLEQKADLGLIFDTDVDRSSAVDAHGSEISRNAIIALSAALVVGEYPNTTIVTDSVTSDELAIFLTQDLGLNHHRFQRGYKNVINEAIRLNESGVDAQVAIETSGHAAFKENYFLDDGAYLATKIVIKAALLHLEEQTIDSLIKNLAHPLTQVELRFSITSEDFSSYGDAVLSRLHQFAKTTLGCTIVPNNYEGIRISFDKDYGNGWFLLRKSLHDPVMALNMESNDLDGCTLMAKTLASFLTTEVSLDTIELTTFLTTKNAS
ncbi:MAG: hypothetical protein ACRCZJ_09415 [Erysipelotrichaceae bacterium]